MARVASGLTKKANKDAEDIAEFVKSINLAETMNECLWVGDKNHKTLYVNPVFEKLSGYSLEECVGQDCVFWFDEKSKQTINSHHKLRPKGLSTQYEATMVSKKGKKIPLLVSGAPTKNGGTIGMFTNLTKVKELTEKELIASQVIRNSSEAIVVLDKSRKVTMWNSGAEKMFGFKEEDMLGKTVDEIVPKRGLDFSKRLLRECDEKSFVRGIEGKRLTKGGEEVDISLSITKVMDSGNFLGFLVIYTDISEKKKAGQELQKRFEAIQDAYKELGLQKRQIDYMHEISNVAVSDVGLSTLENLIVSAVSLLTKADAAILRLHDKQYKVCRLKAAIGVSSKWHDKGSIPFKGSLAEEAFKNRRALIVDHVGTNQKYKGAKLLREHGFRTMILIPLFINGDFLGSVSIYSADPVKFRFIETDFLENFGKQCAIALTVKMMQRKEKKKAKK